MAKNINLEAALAGSDAESSIIQKNIFQFAHRSLAGTISLTVFKVY